MRKIARSVISSVALLLALFLFSPAQPILAADITVDSNCSLPDAIQAAQSDSVVGSCPAGDGADIIHLTGDVTLTAELAQITSDITIEGGGFAISGGDSFRIFHVADGALTLNQLTMTKGSADYGGAIYNHEGTLTIADSAFSNNKAVLSGGAIESAGVLNISGSRFTDNSIELTNGGAISSNGPAIITSSRFSGNTASLSGGAISNISEMSIVGSHFTNNTAEGGGGGGGAIINNSGQLSVADSTFTGNWAEDSGGAINNHTPYEGRIAHMSVTNSIFVGNQTKRSGGAIINSGEADIIGSSFEANLARLFGGAIANYGPLIVSNSTLSGNIGIERGGGFHSFGDVTANLQHLTLANNLSKEGGGIFVWHKDTALDVYNSLIFGNDGGDCSGQLNHNSGNLIADGSCDPDFQGDPMLGELVEPEDGSPAHYPLLPDSPAIDAANPDFCTDTDQTGTARPQGDGCDIGAIEFTGE